MACEGDRRLEQARLEAVVFPEFPPLSCMVHTRELSGPTSNSTAAPTLGLLEASKEARSHLNQQDILTAPLTDSLALPECTVSPPLPFSPLLGCMHCLYCTEKGRDSRSEEERMERGQAQHRPSQPQPHQPELASLQERQRGGVCMGGVSACPQPDVPGGAGASGRASL